MKYTKTLKHTKTLFMVASCATISSSYGALIVTNGGFEADGMASGISAGGFEPTGWMATNSGPLGAAIQDDPDNAGEYALRLAASGGSRGITTTLADTGGGNFLFNDGDVLTIGFEQFLGTANAGRFTLRVSGAGFNVSREIVGTAARTVESEVFDLTGIADGTALNLALIRVGSQGSFVTVDNVTASVVVPEPSSTALLGLGGLALIMRRRK